MTQEAMLAGLVVIATTTGGTKEILRDGENGLAFEAEDANALADRIGRLIDDPVLCRRLAATARRNVLEQYTLEKMVDRIENYLQEVLCSVPPANFPERLTWQ